MEPKKKTNRNFIVITTALLLMGGTYGIYKFVHSLSHEDTDDAQVEAHMSPVIPHVGGYVDKVYVSDNQIVKKGDTLFLIDNRDYLVKLSQAKALLSAAESGLMVSEASIGSYRANAEAVSAQVGTATQTLESAKTRLWRAENDFKRYENLYANHSITTQQYEQSLAAKQEAENNLRALENQKKATTSQHNAAASQTEISKKQVSVAEANVESAQAQLDAAQLNLDYTVVTAAIDGQLSNVDLQEGQFVQPGQSLFYIVDTHEIWVVANFKETQLSKMKTGQKVTIKADAYPDASFEGVVNTFSPATGARFSLLPPDNATGNFVKTIQRLPVKIDFTQNNNVEGLHKLRAGMNVEVDVHLN